MGKSIKPAEFCNCLAVRLYTEFKNEPKKVALLKEGKFDEACKDRPEIIGEYYEDCFSKSSTTDSAVKITFTPQMEEKIRSGLKEQLSKSDFEKTNDIDKYCDCILKAYKTEFSAQEIIQADFSKSEKFQRTNKKCGEFSRLK